MPRCGNCGGKMRRVHRTFLEKLLYLALYECRDCLQKRPEPRRTTFYLGEYPRCPRCGSYRLRHLVTRDHIDPLRRTLLSRIQQWLGGNLYHCRYCRLQFYDLRRRILPEAIATAKAVSANPAQEPRAQISGPQPCPGDIRRSQ